MGLGRILEADTYQPTYPIFAKIIIIRILGGYVSIAYPVRIRIRYVSDTRYATKLTYPCNRDPTSCSESWCCL